MFNANFKATAHDLAAILLGIVAGAWSTTWMPGADFRIAFIVAFALGVFGYLVSH